MVKPAPGWLVADGILASLFGVDKSRYDWELHQHHHEEAEVSSSVLVCCYLLDVEWMCMFVVLSSQKAMQENASQEPPQSREVRTCSSGLLASSYQKKSLLAFLHQA